MSQINGPLLSASNSKSSSMGCFYNNALDNKSAAARRRSKQPQNHKQQLNSRNDGVLRTNSAATLKLYQVEPVSLFEK